MRKRRQRPTDVKPNYADTARGVNQFLTDETTLNLLDAEYEPDPVVEGVWKVTLPAVEEFEFAVVYLAGYRDLFGYVRTEDDFECCEREFDEDFSDHNDGETR